MNIIPSIASGDMLNLESEVKRLGSAYKNLHIDIEDGCFVPNITMGLHTIKALRTITTKDFSVHLMVRDPMKYIEPLAKLQCSHIFVHVEGVTYIRELISQIKSFDIKAGIALNPISHICTYEYLWQDLDAVLYMTSEPDGLGQQFNKEILNKIFIPNRSNDIEGWADGGIRLEHLNSLSNCGIQYAVMGRQVMEQKHKDFFLEKYNNLK